MVAFFIQKYLARKKKNIKHNKTTKEIIKDLLTKITISSKEISEFDEILQKNAKNLKFNDFKVSKFEKTTIRLRKST